MGQATSTAAVASRAQGHRSSNLKSRFTAASVSPMLNSVTDDGDNGEGANLDYISDLPDECLASVFQSLSSADRNRCSLVCRRWLQIEGQSRHRLSLIAQSDLLPFIPSLFSRFDSVTKLALKCDRRSVSICEPNSRFLHRARSFEHPLSNGRTIRRTCSASLEFFSNSNDDDFDKKIQDLALRFQLSDDDNHNNNNVVGSDSDVESSSSQRNSKPFLGFLNRIQFLSKVPDFFFVFLCYSFQALPHASVFYAL